MLCRLLDMDSFIGVTQATKKGIGFVAYNVEKQQKNHVDHGSSTRGPPAVLKK
jgi:hypothetical protein